MHMLIHRLNIHQLLSQSEYRYKHKLNSSFCALTFKFYFVYFSTFYFLHLMRTKMLYSYNFQVIQTFDQNFVLLAEHHYYAALLPIASHSVCPSVCPSVPLSLPSVTSFRQPLASRMYLSARTEGRISYGHLGRTDSCLGLQI